MCAVRAVRRLCLLAGLVVLTLGTAPPLTTLSTPRALAATTRATPPLQRVAPRHPPVRHAHAALASRPKATVVTTTVDDSAQGTGANQFDYAGSGWVHCATPPSGANCSTAYYAGTNSADATANDAVTFAFTGTGITYYATIGGNRGIAAVSIDTGSATSVDLYAATTHGNVPVYASPALPYGPHTLHVRVTGTHNASASNTYVTVDRVDVTANVTTVDDGAQGTGSDQFNYAGSGWVHCATPPGGANCSAAYYAGTNSADFVANDAVTFSFVGTGVTYYATTYVNRGIAAVSVDGGGETMIDLYAPTTQGNMRVFTSPTLPYGAHTLKIRVTGMRDTRASNDGVTVDRVDVANVATLDDSAQGSGDGQFSYVGSGWAHCAAPPSGANCSAAYYAGTNSADFVANDAVVLHFTGTGVTYYATTYVNRGIAAVSIDGGGETTIDLYAPTTHGNVPVYASPTLPYGPHTLKVRVTGTRDTHATNDGVTVDRADVTLSPPLPPAPTATATARPTSTSTPRPSATFTPTATPTTTPTTTPTNTAAPSPTMTATSTPTPSPSPSATATNSPTGTSTATATATAAVSGTVGATTSPTAATSASVTATETPSPSPTATATLTSTATPSPSATATACIAAGAAPYLHTCGSQIVDAAGTPIRLHAVNWYGFDNNDFVAAGLHDWSYKTIIARIKALGFDTLRMPFSNELVERNPVVSSISSICHQGSCVPVPGTTNTPITGAYLLAAISDTVQSNSDLVGLDALHVLKTIVDYAGSQGLRVILDDHRSEAAWGPEENGLWYSSATCAPTALPFTCYDPQSWLTDWRTVATVFADDPAVIGMDVRNEWHWYNPAPSGGGTNWQPANCGQFVQYAHWGPCNGLNNSATDIAQAATQAGNELLATNPRWLIFVEGGSTYPQDSGGATFSKDGWGENVQGAATDPIALTVPHQVVYAPHDYRWYQTNATVSAMYSAWNRNFGFVAVPGHTYTTPLWVGEYGTCTDRYPNADRNTCIMSTAPGTTGYDEAGWWFNTFRFYAENQCVTDSTTGQQVCPAGAAPTYLGGPLNWGYWTANGIFADSWNYGGNGWKTCYGQRESYGILGGDMATTSNQLLQQSLFQGPSADPAATLATAPPPSGPWPSYTCAPYAG